MLPALKRFLPALLFWFTGSVSLALAQQQGTLVELNGQQLSFSRDISSWISNFRPDQQAYQSALVQPLQLLSESEKTGSEGITIAGYLGQGIYLVYFRSLPALEQFSRQVPLRGIAPVSYELKLQAYLKEQIKAGGMLSVLVQFHSLMDKAGAEQLAQQCGGKVLPGHLQRYGIYALSLPAANLPRLAGNYAVQYVSRQAELTPLDQDSKGGEGAISLGLPVTFGGPGLTGKGIVVGHGDECSGIYHIDQSDRIINYNPSDIKSHGVLTNGILGGDGIMNPAGQGIATDALFLSHFFSNVVDLQEPLFQGHNMIITNNSYTALANSAANAGVYDVLSQYMDRLAFITPEVLDVFAAGNDGRAGWNGYPAGFANVCGGYQPSKNVLVVGALYRNLLVGEGSSRGPVRDGRLKPEMTAMGMDIMCPVPDNTYTVTRGTSLSCPQVSGGAALLAERYKALHSGANPRSDLLKILLMNGCTELGNPGPDFLYGFGLMNLRRSLDMLENNRYEKNTLSAGASPYVFTIPVPANTAQLKVMLYYHDPAASSAAATQLVNDLDLVVSEPGGGTSHRPLILDPSRTGVGNTAVEGVDRLNNVEQVTINRPAAGNYTVSVAAFSIPAGPQNFVIAYDFVPDRLQLLYPVAHALSPADTAMYLYWDAPDDPVQTFSLEYSIDNGSSWATMASGIPANTRSYKWAVPSLNSAEVKVRLSRGSATDISGAFTINQQPVLSLAPAQCPGSIAINWTTVSGADKYYLLRKDGAHMRKIDSVNGSTFAYTYTGLRSNTRYFLAVQPSFSGTEGYRSNALIRQPADGDCSGAGHGDIAITAITEPMSGRRFTRSALQLHTPIRIRVRNQDNIAVAKYSVSYKINSGAWVTYPGLSIAANAVDEPIIEYYDFTTPGDYKITVAIQNNDRPDPVTANDTFTRTIRHLPNNPVSLISPVSSDFEALPDLSLSSDTTGLTAGSYWDYKTTTDTGRLRSRIPGSRLVTSTGSISMDVSCVSKQTLNLFTGNFNLSAYDTTADEIRLDFDYEMRGMPELKDSNKLWVRGNDTAIWIPAFTYSNAIDTEQLHHSGTISLKDLFSAAGQNFSAATQLRFGQFDSTVIADDHYGGGLTLDNIRLYKVQKDIALSQVISPQPSNCNLAASPVAIRIKNGTIQPAIDISAAYSLDGGTPVTEAVPGILAGKDSILFTFSKTLSGLSFGEHKLSVWIHTSGDDYLKNDSVLNYSFVISPMIETFPYLEQFEAGPANWYASGFNSSWAYGKPASPKVSYAASGTGAWKTNLNGPYNSNEKSYLYSPCFNTSALANPMLSFSTVIETEQCDGTLCDEAHIEYSTDNEGTWIKLGSAGSGTNWYNDTKNQVWSLQNNTRWRVASATLPKAAQLKLRFALQTDPGSNMEGIAVDDVHIFDRKAPIGLAAVTPEARAVVSGTAPVDFVHSSGILTTALPAGADAGSTLVRAYPQSKYTDNVNDQYIMPRSLVLLPDALPAAGLRVRLYLSDYEVIAELADTSCKTCSRAADAYRTGVSAYKPGSGEEADGSLDNNNKGSYRYHPWPQVNWVPYDQGYYAEFTAGIAGEYWFNNGGITGTLPVNTDLLDFQAVKASETEALLSWHSGIDTLISTYIIERGTDSLSLDSLSSVASLQDIAHEYAEKDIPGIAAGDTVYYRLRCRLENGRQFYSDTKPVYWIEGNHLIRVYPVPSRDGNIHIEWTAAPGTSAQVQINDITGRIVFSGSITASGWANDHLLQLHALSKGMFFLKMNIGTASFTRKLIFY